MQSDEPIGANRTRTSGTVWHVEEELSRGVQSFQARHECSSGHPMAVVTDLRHVLRRLRSLLRAPFVRQPPGSSAGVAENHLARAIAENAASCAVILDERGYATYINGATRNVTSFTLDDLTGRPLHDVIHYHASESEGRSSLGGAVLSPWCHDGGLKKTEDLFVRKDGAVFPVVVSLTPIWHAEQRAGAVLGTPGGSVGRDCVWTWHAVQDSLAERS